MAQRSKSLVGLDIDPSGISAAQVAVNGRVVVEHAAVAELEAGIVRDGEVADVDGLADALRRLFREHKELDKRVRVGVANSKIVVRVVDLPPITDDKELAAAVRFSAQDHIPMPLDSAVVDFQPLEMVETPDGPRRRVLLVAARRDMIEKVLAAVRGAGLRPEGVDLSAFAMVRALHRRGEVPDERVLYLAIAGLTNLAVAQGTTCLFTRATGGGVEALAVELAERRALTLEHARAWLVHVGLDRPVELVDGDPDVVTEARQVLIDGVRRIATEVRQSLDFHHAQDAGGVNRVVLTGPAIAVPGFAEALGVELALPVEVGHVDGAPENLEPGRLTVAAGLAVTEAPHA